MCANGVEFPSDVGPSLEEYIENLTMSSGHKESNFDNPGGNFFAECPKTIKKL